MYSWGFGKRLKTHFSRSRAGIAIDIENHDMAFAKPRIFNCSYQTTLT
ncbi:MAG: hypothetical protein ACJAYF_003711 [Arenicella sp.]|jgi:hypothetical protein